MSEPQADSQTLVSLPPYQPDQREGPPKTPYAILIAVVGIIGTYSFLFKMWDASDFPETLVNPDYWLLLCLIFLVAGISATLLRKKGRWLDSIIIGTLLIASVGSLFMVVLVDLKARPSDKTFTIVLFSFSNHTSTENLGENLRVNVKNELERKFSNEILVLDRDRELKGEKLDEKVIEARKWGVRRSGCHLAVWAELSTNPDGESYSVNLHSVSVDPFGKQLNHEEVKLYDDLDWNTTATLTGPANAVGQETVDWITSRLAFSYGLANYAKPNYLDAVRILSTVGTPRSEFFAGRAARRLGEQSDQPRKKFQQSETHYLLAIALDEDGSVLLHSYTDLGYLYGQMLAYGVTTDPAEDAKKGDDAYSKAAEIYEKRGIPLPADLFMRKGMLLLNFFSVAEDKVAAAQSLKRAETAANEAIGRLGPQSQTDTDTHSLLGMIYDAKGEHLKAMNEYHIALKVHPPLIIQREIIIQLGYAQTHRAFQTKDKQLYDEGMANLAWASQDCGSSFCYLAHMNAGKGSLLWANGMQDGSPDWIRQIERALEEFTLATNFVSNVEQPQQYADAKQLIAEADTDLGWISRGTQRSTYFKAALTALTDGINALEEAHRNSVVLRGKRADCYNRIGDDLPEGSAKEEYFRLGRQERELSRKLADKTASK